MAAGGGSSSSASGGDRRVSSAGGLESSVDRKFQAVSNTMESIQGLSSWCIENKKHSAVVVRHWIRSLKRADSAQRLNLFYVANDVIQNCKRKNAMVYRSAFAEVLPGAALLVKDAAVRKAVERIFTIWEERNVYPEELIAELKTGLVKKEAPVPVNPKAALKSKIVAEFTPQTFIDQLAAYKRSVDEVDIKEKQLATMRVDVCSTETLKRLKDKAGGKRFSKDFEDGSAKLEEFVSFLETRVRSGPPLIEALENADVFYEAQYKEVKIVANAYKTFANRVGNLKKKLDLLKSSLPDPEESPVPSPSMDAPSPTGSESPFHDMEEEGAGTTGDVDGVEMDEPFGGVTPRSSSPEPTEDNRDVEDMELSDDEGPAHQHIIVDERREEQRDSAVQSGSSPTRPLTGTPARQTPLPGIPLPSLANVDLGKISSILSSLTSVMKSTGASPVSRPSPGTPPPPPPPPRGPKTPVHGPSAPANANPLASILSKVDVTAEGILSALSKTPGQPGPSLQGLSSLLQGVAVGNSQPAPHTTKDRAPSTTTPSSSSSSSSLTPSQLPAPSRSQPGHSFSSPAHEVSSSSATKSQAAPSNSSSRNKQPSSSSAHRGNKPGKDGPPARQQQQEPSTSSPSPSSLELKIHRFLQGNPGFSALNLNIPILGGGGGGGGSAGGEASEANASGPEFLPSQLSENVEGTPVRDERGGTPTQDEMMDKPSSSSVSSSSSSSLGVVYPMSLLSKILSPGPSSTPSAPSPLLGRDGYTPNPKLLSNSTSSGQNKTVNKNDDGKLTKSKVAAIGVATTSASNAASISSTTPYSQGARLDLSPTAYRAQAGSWGGQQPSSSSLGGLVDAPPENFYPDNEEGEEEGGYEYGCAEKRPPKVITKGGAGGGGGKHQRRPSSEGGTREYKNKKPSTPSSSGNRQQKDSGGYNNSNNNNGNFNSRPSPSPSGHGYGYGSGGSEGAPSPSPKASEVFFPPTSDPAGANHSKHFGGLADSSPHSGRHLVSSQSGGGAGTGQPNSFGRGGLGNRGGGGEKPQLSSPTSSSLEFKKISNNNNNNTNNPNSSSSSRKSSDSEFGGHPRDRDFPTKGPEQDEEHYRIETRVSSSDPLPDSTVGKGAPIETLGYNNCRMSGERIQTVESIRVIGKGTLPAGEGGAWYESGEPYMEPPSDLSGVPPLPPPPPSSSSSAPPPPPLMAGLPHQQQQPPPHPGFGNQFEDCLPLQHFQDTPGGPFFGNSHTLLPPIPLLPPPPPGTPRDFGMPPNPPMMLLLDPSMPPQPVPNNQFPPPPQDGAPTPLLPPLPQLLKPPPLMGDHPPHPRPGTVKEYFGGLPRPLPSPTEQHPPNLGRVRESLGGHGHLLPAGPPPGSPREQCGGLQQGGAPQQRHRLPPPLQQQHRMDGGMVPLLPPRPKPFQQQRHPHPLQTGPYFRNPRPDFRPREPHFHPREPFRGAKRPRPSFMGVGGGGGPFYAPKRPFLPPRY
ncbi:regulation of nuclear pre-mRNA domain-containing protein 2-like isoform X1 [Huso huso]|uniref:Regulation of nuclear pre-mRNA domain-containing protein 2-like isoform X1 n=1 Tax=Huso huso TaxID=61971 RepID=A0ABR0Y3A7_HUSHU